MNIAEKLSDYSYSINFENLPKEVIHEVKKRVIDSLGCAMGAFNSKPCKIARDVANLYSGKFAATILGTKNKSSVSLASFSNCAMVRYLDFNDTYLSKEPAHPSDNICAALAIAEAENSSGKELITAIVLGYEIQCRLCDAASLRSKGWDHVTYGAFSTSLMASKLMKLPKTKIVHALGLAGTPNIALRQTRVGELSMWKGCAFANSAIGGIFAAMLAREGMTGPAPIFEGEKGFMKQVTGPFKISFDGRFKRFKIMDTYIKKYPAEYHSQASIESALKLRKELDNINNIKSIDVEIYKAAVDIIGGEKEKWNPKTKETADHSLPYIIGAALIDGTIDLSSFTSKRINDKKLRSLVQKVAVRENKDFTKQYPKSFPQKIIINLKSGKRISSELAYPHGHPKNPMTDQEVENKFRGLSKGLLPQKQMDDVLKKLWNLEKIKNLKDLISMLIIK